MSDNWDVCEGGCTCGEVRYKVHDSPLIVHACHCRWCQRQTGGPHVINALYEKNMVEVTQGSVVETTVPSPSGEGQTIARCPKCHNAIWSNYLVTGLGDQIRFLRAGTLDNPDLMPPDIHIFTSTKLPWYELPKEQMSVEEYYETQKTWSDRSFARLNALKEAQ